MMMKTSCKNTLEPVVVCLFVLFFFGGVQIFGNFSNLTAAICHSQRLQVLCFDDVIKSGVMSEVNRCHWNSNSTGMRTLEDDLFAYLWDNFMY